MKGKSKKIKKLKEGNWKKMKKILQWGNVKRKKTIGGGGGFAQMDAPSGLSVKYTLVWGRCFLSVKRTLKPPSHIKCKTYTKKSVHPINCKTYT